MNVKRSACFAITFTHVSWCKDALGEFLTAGNLVQRLAIGEEPHHPPLDCLTGEIPDGDFGRHHHCFVEFKEKYLFKEVQEIIGEFLEHNNEHGYDLQVKCTGDIFRIIISVVYFIF